MAGKAGWIILLSCMPESSSSPTGNSYQFVWPYNDNGECSCGLSPAGKYLSEGECRSSFSESNYETCTFQHKGLTKSQCKYVVSNNEYILNSDCAEWCSSVALESVAGLGSRRTSSIMKKLHHLCRFEFVEYGNSEVVLDPDTCYDQYLYGYGDVDPVATKAASDAHIVYNNVKSPQGCQQLCQENDNCARWALRVLADDQVPESIVSPWPFLNYIKFSKTVSLYENQVHTCVLYTTGAVKAALTISADTVPKEYDAGWKLCDFSRAVQCSNTPNPNTGTWDETDRPCLKCHGEDVCAFKSLAHISGPRFCSPTHGDKGKTLCSIPEDTRETAYDPMDLFSRENVTQSSHPKPVSARHTDPRIIV